ncbi:MAG TPA: bifunctional 5,10-methylene-tetrahydrofolate dehydrogenase/5,10-methylene-tetrahydrofolate cyclohydrolase [Cryomorphaceae bacterium]|jgi:methylenetetrahydrofolate dehydrogenase (NADP+)/methenyltetrahydrofolate cyclohydrolase|nr:bifunctional 5,10-methylene-tetrahydrofolate dehydrogenase/5,10-methylene-tetrahydrofolate cyclohydrolase [Cryomorphaceae bacterium]
MAQLLSGKVAAAAWKEKIRNQVIERLAAGKTRPHLAAILVGDDPASRAYVRGKVKDCEEVGFESTLINLPATATEDELLHEIRQLNANPSVSGYIVQLPLPKHFDDKRILLAIDPEKDVDGFHPDNVGRMALGLPTYLPATPYGVLLLLEHFQISTESKHAVIVGRSHIVGSPMSILLGRNGKLGNATATLTHSKTPNLHEITRQADILVAAIGKPLFIRPKHVKHGAIVIDVGINRVDDKLVGDVDFERVEPIASAISPVPGGVGLMTRVGLLMNTLRAADGRG